MLVIGVTGLKGGVGKTSTAVNLAATAASRGFRVLVWDLDPQAAATWCLGVDPTEEEAIARLSKGRRSAERGIRRTGVPGLSLIGSDLSLRLLERRVEHQRRPNQVLGRALRSLSAHYDLVIVDTPPGLGVLLDNLIEAAHVLLLPTEPAPLAVRATQDMMSYVSDRAPDLSVVGVLSMVDEHKPLHRRTEATVAGTDGFLTSAIPRSSAVERMGEERIPTVLTSPRSLAAARYAELWDELTRVAPPM